MLLGRAEWSLRLSRSTSKDYSDDIFQFKAPAWSQSFIVVLPPSKVWAHTALDEFEQMAEYGRAVADIAQAIDTLTGAHASLGIFYGEQVTSITFRMTVGVSEGTCQGGGRYTLDFLE